MNALSIDSPAPDFDLPCNNGERISLAKLKNSKVVLYFYPKDDTSGCTMEAINFTALKNEFQKAEATIIGISPDSVTSHEKFCKKHNLSILLASDEEKTVVKAYGVWKERSMYGKKFMGVERTTFLIDKNGILRKIWENVKVPGHTQAVLEAVKSLQ
ncbi:Thiol peroxidase, Bcp-type [Liberibacter crescens BT-1]|uniref:thioredoxin-dependent peroxiredoxin n=1 Tax=Liberibacter crescens (strain BT-1) TaxID=1215343 RepID=L0EUQ3_LIBCB|nr:thioredoxin-dependent thiol peroxidase [Liberibacter crescens]AGA64560.1 Thiol peroxidase, Bcp-type [Liberibacter crescens BT-1]AMC12703.1 alkyl hydroperoxide reductase [Liberibacter crescens]